MDDDDNDVNDDDDDVRMITHVNFMIVINIEVTTIKNHK